LKPLQRAEAGLRDKVQIATKVGLGWDDGRVYRDSRPGRIRQEIEDSLRLRTHVIDLYQGARTCSRPHYVAVFEIMIVVRHSIRVDAKFVTKMATEKLP
jgi:aryl-alcohol dehydrogenase-like predicted oxidoreductase